MILMCVCAREGWQALTAGWMTCLTPPTPPFALLNARGPVGDHVQGMDVYTSLMTRLIITACKIKAMDPHT